MESLPNTTEMRDTAAKLVEPHESAFLVPIVKEQNIAASFQARSVLYEKPFTVGTENATTSQPAESFTQRSLREFNHWKQIIAASWKDATLRERVALVVGAGLQIPAMLLHLLIPPVHAAVIYGIVAYFGLSPLSLLFYPASVLAFIVTSGFTYHGIGFAILLMGPKEIRQRALDTFRKTFKAIGDFLKYPFTQKPKPALTPILP